MYSTNVKKIRPYCKVFHVLTAKMDTKKKWKKGGCCSFKPV